MSKNDPQKIIYKHIKPKNDIHAAHGTWKIVYADFMTAMMAFFLLLWIISGTKSETQDALSEYFRVTEIITSTRSGAGKIFGGILYNESGKIEVSENIKATNSKSLNKSNVDPNIVLKGSAQQESAQSTNNSYSIDQIKNNRDVAPDSSASIEESLLALTENFIHPSQIHRSFENGTNVSITDRPDGRYFYPQSTILTDNARQTLNAIGEHFKKFKNIHFLIAGWADEDTAPEDAIQLSMDRALTVRRFLEKREIDIDQFSEILARGKPTKNDSLLQDNYSVSMLIRVFDDQLKQQQILPPDILNN
ncbi:MAG: flagellar motor protein MotB [Pseudomonadota bacterium]